MYSIILATAIAVSNSVSSVSSDSAISVAPIIVEASRLEQTQLATGAHVDTIDAGQITAAGAVNSVDVLEKRANIFIRKMNSNPTQAQISMRGYGANGFSRVKILVDGEELNNPDMSSQNLMRVPVRSIRKVEILHGPQTVMHGGDASAGVINITSDSNITANETELEIHGGNLGQIGAYAGTSGRIDSENLENIIYFANLAYDRSDGWRKNSWFDLWSLKAGIKQIFDNEANWSFKSFYSNSRYGLPGGLFTGGTYGNWRSRERTADDVESQAENNVYGINISGKGVIDDENSVTAMFAFRNRQSESYDYLTYDIYNFNYQLQYTNKADLFDYENQFDIGTDFKHDIIYADAYNEKTQSGGKNDFVRFAGAVFVRDEFWPCDEISIFGGVRGEWYHSRDEYAMRNLSGGESVTKRAVAGEVGVNWRPSENLKVFTRWSHFYHTPLADELFSAYGTPNMDLQPERGNNYELGVDWTFRKEFNCKITGFHSELDDEILYMNYANRNAPNHTARSGLEASCEWSRAKFGSFGVMYSYVYARFTEGAYKNNDLPMVPRQQLRIFCEYRVTDEIALNGGFRLVGRQRYGGDFGNEGGALPEYGLFDAGISVTPHWRPLKGFTFAFTIDNLFDKRYCDYGEYFGSHYVYPASGRSFVFTVSYKF